MAVRVGGCRGVIRPFAAYDDTVWVEAKMPAVSLDEDSDLHSEERQQLNGDHG